MSNEIKVYTPIEVAEITKQSLATIYRHIKDGKIKSIKLGANVRITQENLDKYLKGE